MTASPVPSIGVGGSDALMLARVPPLANPLLKAVFAAATRAA